MPLTLKDDVRTLAAKVGRHLPDRVHRTLQPWYAKVMGDAAPVTASPPAGRPAIAPRRPLGPYPVVVAAPELRPDPLRVWPQPAPAGYLGQLEVDAQQGLAQRWSGVELSDCLFYHWVRLADGRVVEGFWDLIGGEDEYLGGMAFDGRRVLELGPASGWLTAWMEQQGADVVGFDLGWELSQDLLPLPGLDLDRLRPDYLARACLAQNSWWYLHRDLGLSAKAVYGSIYDLPADIGRYDVAVFAAILLHLRDPFAALEQAARVTDQAMVVVEPLSLDLLDHDGLVRWNPTGGLNPTGWWHHSPGAVVDRLKVLGFPHADVTFHHQPYFDEDNDGREEDVPFFTVVARR